MFQAEKEEERRHLELKAMEREEARQWEAHIPCETALSFHHELPTAYKLQGSRSILLFGPQGSAQQPDTQMGAGQVVAATLGNIGGTYYPSTINVLCVYTCLYSCMAFILFFPSQAKRMFHAVGGLFLNGKAAL